MRSLSFAASQPLPLTTHCLPSRSTPLPPFSLQDVASLRAELGDLRRYVALNYIAVVKAAKKRNRHLKVC